ncbi:hypothetical protein QJS04_geneDACA006424 [Acorus gramineus]|uniref:MATH domain-containing protein n=1 Tax=Acorus gramineus TaxID=55184 RepID=A0AAV9B1C2_ACOGR|nr:hypothetical protein QJS04_geneDACA006424 [Acorus gramineus]
MKPSSTPSSPPAESSATSSSSSPFLPTTAGAPPQVLSAAAAEDPSPPSTSQESMAVDRRGPHAASCRWTVPGFPRIKARALWSRYFDVGGYDCRLLVYPRGDSQALPGYFSVYLQVVDPRRGPVSSASNRWDCFASYRLSVVHLTEDSRSVHRDSWHRFSSKKKSHGWCDFTPSSTLLDPKSGFLNPSNDSIVVSADVLILDEVVSFSGDEAGTGLGGKFTWRVRNFSLFRDMMKTQKIMSPLFPAGDCNLRISVYQSSVSGVDYLSMCLESKDTDKASASSSTGSGGGGTGGGGNAANGGGGASAGAVVVVLPPAAERSCWCLFRMSAMNQMPGAGAHVHRDSYGRFAADSKSGDNTSLGWNDYMRMEDFVMPDAGFVVDDTAVFSASFHVIRESCSFSKSMVAGGRWGGGQRKVDGHVGRFTWRIENFTRLKDLLKKKKITGLCVKSRRFQIGNRDCRLIVYPRGQSQPPCHLSVFLEVTDPRNTSTDWSCFVSHRLSVVNQKVEEKSVTKESQNRYSKAAKDWGWREFVTLTSLFDQDSGFLVQDTVVFSAEVLILKETSTMQNFAELEMESSNGGSQLDGVGKKAAFTWKVENFLSFKEIMETRKIFSRFFQAGGCELRIGVYESFDTICIYLESDQSACSDHEKNFWVRYRMAVVNQKNPAKTVWKESSICTRTWNNSVLQFMKVSDMLETDAGFLMRDTVVFVCEILDCCPWFEFSDLEVLASEDDQDALSTDPDELIDSEDSEGMSGDEEDILRNLLAGAGFHLTYGDNPSQPQVSFREKLLMDAGAIAGFLSGLRVYLDDPAKIKRLLLPTRLSSISGGKLDTSKNDATSPSLMNLLMGVKNVQQAIIDLLLDIMVECCQPSDGRVADDYSGISSKSCLDSDGHLQSSESIRENEAKDSAQCSINQRLHCEIAESSNAHAILSSDLNTGICGKYEAGQNISPPEASAEDLPVDDDSVRLSKTKCPEQSEELLQLIVNSLRALDSAVPQGCPEPRRRSQSIQKIALVLDKVPRNLQADLVALIPKLVDCTEHSIAACTLLDWIQKSETEPSLRLPVLDALNQLEFGSELWERILVQALMFLTDLNDEPLAAALGFVFKAASQCCHLPQAIRAIRARLKSLGTEVSPCVLDVLVKTVSTQEDVAEAFLRDIDSDSQMDACGFTTHCGSFRYLENGPSSEGVHVGDEQVFSGGCQVSDVYILIDMLYIPCLFVEASQVFERAVSQGAIGVELVALALQRRHAQRLKIKSGPVTDDPQNKQVVVNDKTLSLTIPEDDFAIILTLAEELSPSGDPRVQGFVRTLYSLLFKMYDEGNYRGRLLKALVDRATSTIESCRETDLDLDILVFLVREEEEIARPVLCMMREVAELANVDRAALWHQLSAIEGENIRFQEERQTELSNFAREKAALSQRLTDFEATTSHLKSELKAEMDRFAREKKELSEQLLEYENQLEWLRLEKDDEIAKISTEKFVLQDRLHDAEAQISQLKSRKRDELKKVVKEKNALTERLKNAEAARKRFDEELKRYATEKVTREEVRQSLEDEVRRLTQTVGQTEGEKREKEEQVARCEAYIDGMEAKLQACQQYIHTLEASLQEEMSRHAPLYGAGLEALSMKELETLSRIHEEGLRQIHALQQQRQGANNPLGIAHSHGLYPTLPPMAIGLPPPMIPNGTIIHGNGHVNGAMGPWFNPS